MSIEYRKITDLNSFNQLVDAHVATRRELKAKLKEQRGKTVVTQQVGDDAKPLTKAEVAAKPITDAIKSLEKKMIPENTAYNMFEKWTGKSKGTTEVRPVREGSKFVFKLGLNGYVSESDIQDSKIRVRNDKNGNSIVYDLTPGLSELLFKPYKNININSIPKADVIKYHDIMQFSGTHHKSNNNKKLRFSRNVVRNRQQQESKINIEEETKEDVEEETKMDVENPEEFPINIPPVPVSGDTDDELDAPPEQRGPRHGSMRVDYAAMKRRKDLDARIRRKKMEAKYWQDQLAADEIKVPPAPISGDTDEELQSDEELIYVPPPEERGRRKKSSKRDKEKLSKFKAGVNVEEKRAVRRESAREKAKKARKKSIQERRRQSIVSQDTASRAQEFRDTAMTQGIGFDNEIVVGETRRRPVGARMRKTRGSTRQLGPRRGRGMALNPDALINRLSLLTSALQGGNSNVVDEIWNITDNLYNNNIITKAQHKLILSNQNLI